MPTDLVTEAVRMVEAFGLVAAGAVPVGLAAWACSRRLGRPIVPRWRRVTATWTGIDVLALFVLHILFASVTVVVLDSSGFFSAVYGPDLPELRGPGHVLVEGFDEAARRAAVNQLRGLWAALVAAPGVAFAAFALRSRGNDRPPTVDLRVFPGRVAFGVGGWVCITPVVLAVHFGTAWAADRLGVAPDTHPVTQIPLTDLANVVLFAVVVCGLTPFVEELLFRGVMLGWAMKRRGRPAIALAAGAVLAGVQGGVFESPTRWGAVTFAAVLAGGLAILLRRRGPSRTTTAVYATAAAFALIHSSVWPTPIPIFPLGLGLGYLAARTRGITASVVAHGLFNAVSFVYLLRGGAGGM